MPLLAFTPSESVRNQLALSWGTQAVLVPTVESTDEMVSQVDSKIKSLNLAEDGDLLVVVSGAPVGVPGTTNSILVHRLGEGA